VAGLREHRLDDLVSEVTDRKPAAHVFVDDRAVSFRGDYEATLREIDTFVAHWEADPSSVASDQSSDVLSSHQSKTRAGL